MYLKFSDTEIDDMTFTDGADLMCYVHGYIKSYAYDDLVEIDELMRDVEEHRKGLHFG